MPDKPDRLYTSKQMGDACEMLVAAELTLAGVPALKVSDNWPGYDVVAQPPDKWPGYVAHPPDKPPQRISVKSRTVKTTSNYIAFNPATSDWLAIVLLLGDGCRQIFIVPQDQARAESFPCTHSAAARNPCGLRFGTIRKLFGVYKGNFKLTRHDL